MKLNILSWIILSLSVIGICSCQDEELLSVPGNYSFKLCNTSCGRNNFPTHFTGKRILES